VSEVQEHFILAGGVQGGRAKTGARAVNSATATARRRKRRTQEKQEGAVRLGTGKGGIISGASTLNTLQQHADFNE
jgi:hypothetical protein